MNYFFIYCNFVKSKNIINRTVGLFLKRESKAIKKAGDIHGD